MQNFIFKRQLVFVVFMFLGCLVIHAADDDLITEQVTVTLDEAGTLPDKITSAKKYKITNLKIIGEINGTDLRLIRDMAGSDYRVQSTNGKLSILDLSEAKIVAGGEYCCYNYGTENDIINYYTFCKCKRLTNIILPSSITYIGGDAFESCSALTTITIPSNVTWIGGSAFLFCSSLESVVIPPSVTSIGSFAFQGCSALKSISIPSSVTTLYDGVFQNCKSLTNISLPSSISMIGNRVFYGCANLTDIIVPSNVTSIGDEVFYYCSNLTTIIFSSSVAKIGDYAFKGCYALTSVYVSWKTPIVISSSVFEIDKKNCTLYVPKGTCHEYKEAGWDIFDNIVEYDATGIGKVTTSTGNAKELSRYAADGQRLDVPTKGLNIVKYSDGSVKKVVVR